MRLTVKVPISPMQQAEMRSWFEGYLSSHKECRRFSIQEFKPRLRASGPAIMVASIGALGASIAALISALLAFAKEKALRKIVLQSASGERLEFPADLPEDKIDMLIAKVREMDGDELTAEIVQSTDKRTELPEQ